MDLLGFDANEVEPSQSFEAIPAGWYVVEITKSEEKPTKSNPEHSYLELELEIMDGEHKGRRLWDRLNLNNSSQKTVEIAQRTLSSICRATGVMAPKNSEQLHFKRMAARVTQREYNGEMRNEVRGYKAIEGGQASAAPTKPSAPERKAPPWQKKSA